MDDSKSIYERAMKATDQTEADDCLTVIVADLVVSGKTPEQALVVAKRNLGYYAGYYDNETRARVERLFRCEHPVFGPIADGWAPTAAEAFAIGVGMGEQLKKEANRRKSTSRPDPV